MRKQLHRRDDVIERSTAATILPPSNRSSIVHEEKMPIKPIVNLWLT